MSWPIETNVLCMSMIDLYKGQEAFWMDPAKGKSTVVVEVGVFEIQRSVEDLQQEEWY